MNSFIYLLLLLTSVFFVGCQSADDEIYILPDNYSGYVLIIYDQENGEIPAYYGEKRVYRIPESGVLKTRFSTNYGVASLGEYYYKEIQEGNKIPFEMINKDELGDNSIKACCFSTGSVYKIDDKSRVKFARFLVGSKLEINNAFKQLESLDIGSLAD
jgi:hypothetical protein